MKTYIPKEFPIQADLVGMTKAVLARIAQGIITPGDENWMQDQDDDSVWHLRAGRYLQAAVPDAWHLRLAVKIEDGKCYLLAVGVSQQQIEKALLYAGFIDKRDFNAIAL